MVANKLDNNNDIPQNNLIHARMGYNDFALDEVVVNQPLRFPVDNKVTYYVHAIVKRVNHSARSTEQLYTVWLRRYGSKYLFCVHAVDGRFSAMDMFKTQKIPDDILMIDERIANDLQEDVANLDVETLRIQLNQAKIKIKELEKKLSLMMSSELK
jgi:hypothetical protein